MTETRSRLIAFYLPQFHPIPENDAWWGKGFTEWSNVGKSVPLFKGHYQPHIPADLGFYDLRVPETRIAQAELAAQYGIEAFCYWHYWFEGRRLLERPFNEVLKSGAPNFRFCLAWANESWSRRWLGEEKEILIKQGYSDQDDLNHIHWLMEAFADPRYVRVNNRPLFMIYRPTDLPNPNKTMDVFRKECVRAGMPEPYLIGANAHSSAVDSKTLGFDATLAFKPELGALPGFMDDRATWRKFRRNLKFGARSPKLKLYGYGYAQKVMAAVRRPFPMIPTVLVGWDNTPRRGENAIIVTNSDPDIFERVLAGVVDSVQDQPAGERLVFVNAWNEWAEGNHLEPDLRFGHAFLERVRRVNTSGT